MRQVALQMLLQDELVLESRVKSSDIWCFTATFVHTISGDIFFLVLVDHTNLLQ